MEEAVADSGVWPGLLHADLSPKKAFYRLKTLLDSWRTEICDVTDAEGVIRFNGHKGRYSATTQTPGHAWGIVHEVNITMDKEQEVTLVHNYHPCCIQPERSQSIKGLGV